jgi:hypothetical protein
VVVLRKNHVGKYQQSANSPSSDVLVHGGALAVIGNYMDALVRIVQNQANHRVQGYTMASY